MTENNFLKITVQDLDIGIEKFPELSKINTEYLHCIFLTLQNKQIAVQAALYFPPIAYLDYKKIACFGYYVCPDDKDLSSIVLKLLEKEAKTKGSDFLLGPMNGSTWENYRWNMDQNNPQFFTEENHPLWYHDQVREAGYLPIARYSSHLQELKRKEKEEESPTFGENINIRNIRLNDLENELNRIYELSLTGFQHNFLYTPIQREHFITKYTQLKKWMKEDFILLAEDENKKLCALFFALPDYLNPQKDTLVLKTIVRLPGRKYAGIIHYMQAILKKRSFENGISKWIHAFMYDQNVSRTLSKKFDGELYRKYVLYGKILDPGL